MNTVSRKVLIFLITSRVILLILTSVIANYDKVGDSFTNIGNFLTSYGNRWDGNSYSYIADHSYVRTGSEADFIVFPPIYPLMIAPLGSLIHNYPLAGMILSNIFFVMGVFIFYELLKLDHSEKFAAYVIFLVSIFPTSYFFSVAYPESLFFLIFVTTFYLVRVENIKTSFIFSTLAPLVRPFGVGMYPSLFASWMSNKNRRIVDLIILGLSGLTAAGIYLFLNYAVFGNPFAFRSILETSWQKSFSWPWVGISNSWKVGIFTNEWTDYKILVGFGEAIASTLAWVLLILSVCFKKLRLRVEYTVYLLIGVFLFTSTGFILSAPRYLLSLPPFFIVLAKLTDSKIGRFLWVPISVCLLIILSVRWAQGWWAF